MRLVRVSVKRDNLTTFVKDIPAWEAKVLAYMYDDGNVTDLEHETTDEREYPDAASEMDRLERSYGNDASGTPYVVQVFGQAGRGVKALRKEIEECAEAEPIKAVAHRKAKAIAHNADSLLD